MDRNSDGFIDASDLAQAGRSENVVFLESPDGREVGAFGDFRDVFVWFVHL